MSYARGGGRGRKSLSIKELTPSGLPAEGCCCYENESLLRHQQIYRKMSYHPCPSAFIA